MIDLPTLALGLRCNRDDEGETGDVVVYDLSRCCCCCCGVVGEPLLLLLLLFVNVLMERGFCWKFPIELLFFGDVVEGGVNIGGGGRNKLGECGRC